MSEIYRMLGSERERELERTALRANSRRTARAGLRRTAGRRLFRLFPEWPVRRALKPVNDRAS